MRVGGLFTGIGAHHEVVKSIPGLDVVFQAEIDERTAKTYDMMHGETPNLGDVTKIENLDANPVELLFVSPPCTSISKQGKRAGLGPGTPSGLIYEIPRIIGATKSENRPRIIIWEDVPDIVNKVYLPEWENIERERWRESVIVPSGKSSMRTTTEYLSRESGSTLSLGTTWNR